MKKFADIKPKIVHLWRQQAVILFIFIPEIKLLVVTLDCARDSGYCYY